MHFWGSLLDRAPCQARVVEPHLELNVEMSHSSLSFTQSLVEAFDPEEVLDHLRADLEPVDECISDLGRFAAVCEDSSVVIHDKPEAIEDADKFGEGWLRDERDLSTPPCLGEGTPTVPSVRTLSSPGKAMARAVSPLERDSGKTRMMVAHSL